MHLFKISTEYMILPTNPNLNNSTFIQEDTMETHGKFVTFFYVISWYVWHYFYHLSSYVGKSHLSTLYQRSGKTFHYIGYTVPE